MPITGIGPGHVFVDRGDPSAYDFTLATLTADTAWHEMDLSSIVTDEGAVAVQVVVFMLSGTVEHGGRLCKGGVTNSYNLLIQYIQTAGKTLVMAGWVPLSTDRKLSYKISAGMVTFSLVVRGWLKPI